MSQPAAMPPPAGRAISSARTPWKTECLRALAAAALSAVLALGTNFLSADPVPLLAADGPGALPERAERISAAAFKELLASQKAVLLLDVRRDEAFSAGHAAGALHAPFDDFPAQYERLNLDSRLQAAEEVVLICESDDCLSADRVAKLLKELQYSNVRVLYGGWNAYVDAGFQVEGGQGGDSATKGAAR